MTVSSSSQNSVNVHIHCKPIVTSSTTLLMGKWLRQWLMSQLGTRMASRFGKTIPTGFHAKLSSPVMTMANEKNGVKIDDIFLCFLMVGQQREMELLPIFGYELCEVPACRQPMMFVTSSASSATTATSSCYLCTGRGATICRVMSPYNLISGTALCANLGDAECS